MQQPGTELFAIAAPEVSGKAAEERTSSNMIRSPHWSRSLPQGLKASEDQLCAWILGATDGPATWQSETELLSGGSEHNDVLLQYGHDDDDGGSGVVYSPFVSVRTVMLEEVDSVVLPEISGSS
jgi:hypothetical protein